MNTENNKLIVEFMGGSCKKHENGHVYYTLPNHPTIDISPYHVMDDNVFYHSSWDWLMPVVEKIQACEILTMQGFNVIIYNRVTEIKCRWSGKLIALMQDNTKIESVYTAVVEFITWYNKQQPKK